MEKRMDMDMDMDMDMVDQASMMSRLLCVISAIFLWVTFNRKSPYQPLTLPCAIILLILARYMLAS